MAKRRDIVIGVIIVISFLAAFGFMGLIFIGIMSGDSDFNISGIGGNIGIVEVYGAINEPVGRRAIEELEEWADDNSIKAIVVHVNSPGGGVATGSSEESSDRNTKIAKRQSNARNPKVAAIATMRGPLLENKLRKRSPGLSTSSAMGDPSFSSSLTSVNKHLLIQAIGPQRAA